MKTYSVRAFDLSLGKRKYFNVTAVSMVTAIEEIKFRIPNVEIYEVKLIDAQTLINKIGRSTNN